MTRFKFLVNILRQIKYGHKADTEKYISKLRKIGVRLDHG